MEIQELFLPVKKLPVPPDEVDLMKISIIGSIFQADKDGNWREFRKVYFETSYKGVKVSDGNNIIPAELVPLIFDAKNNQATIDYALGTFGFRLLHDVFETNPNVFKNPYSTENLIKTNLYNETQPISPIPESGQPQISEPTEPEPTTNSGEPAEPEPIITPAN